MKKKRKEKKKKKKLRKVSFFNPGVFFIQESKVRSKNKLKINDYITFKLVQKNAGGRGLLTADHKSLKPVSVSNEDEEEILFVSKQI